MPRKVGYAIGHLPLVKTAFFASDPNRPHPGRDRYAGIADLNVDGVRVWLGSNGEEVLVAEQGDRASCYREEDGSRIMKAEITVRRSRSRWRCSECSHLRFLLRLRQDQRRLPELEK